MAKKAAKKDKGTDFERELEKLEEAVAKLEDGSLADPHPGRGRWGAEHQNC